MEVGDFRKKRFGPQRKREVRAGMSHSDALSTGRLHETNATAA